MDEHQDVGIAGSRLEDPDGTRQNGAFRFPSAVTEMLDGFRLGVLSRALNEHDLRYDLGDQPMEVDWVVGASMIILYLSSTIYHFIHFKLERTKRVFRFFDHASIYLLIAGSYTAITLTFLRGPLGWTLFGLEWGIAILGIVFKSIVGHRADGLCTLGYVVMGWLIVMATYPILTGFPLGGIVWLVAGGLSYTLGVPFFFLDEKIRYFHAIWHLFVLGGSICHFFMVWLYIIPAA